ncbi:Type IV pilus assembly protein PilV [Candidatus Electrothrix aarhusensis]
MEVMIAMAIFTVGVLGLYAMQFNSAKGNVKANQQTGAVAIASQVVEQLMRTPYSDSALSVTKRLDETRLSPSHTAGNSPNFNDGDLSSLNVQHAPYIKSITWEVFDLGEGDPDGNPETEGVKKVDLTVTYQGGRQVDITFLRINMIGE